MCARFSVDPREEHGRAVKRIGRYLRGTRDKGIYMKLDDDNFEVWADADYAGNWSLQDAPTEPDTARSRSGYLIKYLGCPIMWKSQLQTEIALSTTEAEYICLSQALRKAIPIMRLVQEMKERGYPTGSTKPTVLCTAFEDNQSACALAMTPAIRPRTKHINNKYHHFRSFVGTYIDVQHVSTTLQTADTLTKPLGAELFVFHRKRLMGW